MLVLCIEVETPKHYPEDMTLIMVNPQRKLTEVAAIAQRCDAVVSHHDYLDKIGLHGFCLQRDIPIYYYPTIPETPEVARNRPLQSGAYIDAVMQLYRMSLKKSKAYGAAAVTGTGTLGVATRVWEKVCRCATMVGIDIEAKYLGFNTPFDDQFENLNETFLDLAGSSIVGYLVNQNKWGK